MHKIVLNDVFKGSLLSNGLAYRKLNIFGFGIEIRENAGLHLLSWKFWKLCGTFGIIATKSRCLPRWPDTLHNVTLFFSQFNLNTLSVGLVYPAKIGLSLNTLLVLFSPVSCIIYMLEFYVSRQQEHAPQDVQTTLLTPLWTFQKNTYQVWMAHTATYNSSWNPSLPPSLAPPLAPSISILIRIHLSRECHHTPYRSASIIFRSK